MKPGALGQKRKAVYMREESLLLQQQPKEENFLLTRAILLVRVKLVTPLWGSVSELNSNLQGAPNNGIMQGN